MKKSGIVKSESANFTLPNSPQELFTPDEYLTQILQRALLDKKIDIDGVYDGEWQIKSKADEELEAIFESYACQVSGPSLNHDLSNLEYAVRTEFKELDINYWFDARYQYHKNKNSHQKQLIEELQFKEDGFSAHYVYVLHIMITNGCINVIKPSDEKGEWQFNVSEANTNANDTDLLKVIKSLEFSQWFSKKYNHPVSIVMQKNRSELSTALQKIDDQKAQIVGKVVLRRASLEKLHNHQALSSDGKNSTALDVIKKVGRRLSHFKLGDT